MCHVLARRDLPADLDPLVALAALEGAALFREADHVHVLAVPREVVHSLDPLDGAPGEAPESDGTDPPRFFGLLPYEAFRASLERSSWSVREERTPPPCAELAWTRYAAAITFRPGALPRVDADDETTADAVARVLAAPEQTVADLLAAAPGLEVGEPERGEVHRDRVRDARERILDGELYQVNLARRLSLRVPPSTTRAGWVGLFARLEREFPARYRFFQTTERGAVVIGASPELALGATATDDRHGFDQLETWPIKGTRARGATAADDARLRHELEHDEKERAELAMIVDVERNDLHRVCVVGSVDATAPTIDALRTVFHRWARVSGRCRGGVSRADVLAAVLPCGSVTGAPKVRAMEVIAELESERRGLYTGAVGVMTRGGAIRLAMAIRTMVFEPRGEGTYWVGGGIVEGSVPERELEETRWKAAQVFRLHRNTM